MAPSPKLESSLQVPFQKSIFFPKGQAFVYGLYTVCKILTKFGSYEQFYSISGLVGNIHADVDNCEEDRVKLS